MSLIDREGEWGNKASPFIKAEWERAGSSYKSRRMFERAWLEETETAITGSLRVARSLRRFLASLCVLGTEVSS